MVREQGSEVIYLDHAATSWPKPPQVIEPCSKRLYMTRPTRDGAAMPWRSEPAGYCSIHAKSWRGCSTSVTRMISPLHSIRLAL